MPDLYLPFDKCETLKPTPMNAAAEKQLIQARKEKRLQRKERRIARISSFVVSHVSNSQLNDGTAFSTLQMVP